MAPVGSFVFLGARRGDEEVDTLDVSSRSRTTYFVREVGVEPRDELTRNSRSRALQSRRQCVSSAKCPVSKKRNHAANIPFERFRARWQKQGSFTFPTQASCVALVISQILLEARVKRDVSLVITNKLAVAILHPAWPIKVVE